MCWCVNYDAGRINKYVFFITGYPRFVQRNALRNAAQPQKSTFGGPRRSVTSPDFVVDDKRVSDKIRLAMHYVTSTKV